MARGKLTPKQATFVIEYLKDLNATQAAIRAGYSEATAQEISSENLSKPIIQDAIQEQMDARAARTMITADRVIAQMQEVADRCMQNTPVMVFDKVNQKYVQKTETIEVEPGRFEEEGVYEFDSQGANKALENLAKHLKILTEKHEFSGPGGEALPPPVVQRFYVGKPDEIST